MKSTSKREYFVTVLVDFRTVNPAELRELVDRLKKRKVEFFGRGRRVSLHLVERKEQERQDRESENAKMFVGDLEKCPQHFFTNTVRAKGSPRRRKAA